MPGASWLRPTVRSAKADCRPTASLTPADDGRAIALREAHQHHLPDITAALRYAGALAASTTSSSTGAFVRTSKRLELATPGSK